MTTIAKIRGAVLVLGLAASLAGSGLGFAGRVEASPPSSQDTATTTTISVTPDSAGAPRDVASGLPTGKRMHKPYS